MKFAGTSHIGLIRKTNQDNYVVLSNEHGDILGVVCDGIGGGKAGDVASQMVCDYLREQFNKAPRFVSVHAIELWLSEHIGQVNLDIYQKGHSQSMYEGMGTTLVCSICSKSGVVVANVGDSRAYQLTTDIAQISMDHTLVQDLFNKGLISEDQIRNHPSHHILSKAVGIKPTLELDLYHLDRMPNVLMMCSDGLHGFVEVDVIRQLLSKNLTPMHRADQLVEAALAKGGYDNITVVIIERERKYGTH
jgi:PPM family protein phosphatase